jgi:hypothetical protein
MNCLIYGVRRQGKSTLALSLAITHHRRVIVFDPNDQFPILQSIPLSTLPDWLLDSRETPGFVLARVGPFNTDGLEEDFEYFAAALYNEPDISIIVDESHMLQSANSIHPDLDRFNRRTPANVCVIQTTHRVVDCNVRSRYHADHVFFFYAELDKELKEIRANYHPRVADLTPHLRPHQLVRYSRAVGGLPIIEQWNDSQAWFIDLGNHNQ